MYSLRARHMQYTNRCTYKKAQTSVDYSPIEAFALPTKSNKTTGNLRWYDNTLHHLERDVVWIQSYPYRHLLLLWFWFGKKVAKFSIGQTQSVNKRYLICHKTYPKKNLLQNTFRWTYPSGVDSAAKLHKIFEIYNIIVKQQAFFLPIYYYYQCCIIKMNSVLVFLINTSLHKATHDTIVLKWCTRMFWLIVVATIIYILLRFRIKV